MAGLLPEVKLLIHAGADLVEDIKDEMRRATILGQVGYHKGSVGDFVSRLQSIKAKITNVAEQPSEHEVAEMLLNALVKANQVGVSFAARSCSSRRGKNTSWSSSTAQSTPSHSALVTSR